jgi:hypothetical protein
MFPPGSAHDAGAIDENGLEDGDGKKKKKPVAVVKNNLVKMVRDITRTKIDN